MDVIYLNTQYLVIIPNVNMNERYFISKSRKYTLGQRTEVANKNSSIKESYGKLFKLPLKLNKIVWAMKKNTMFSTFQKMFQSTNRNSFTITVLKIRIQAKYSRTSFNTIGNCNTLSVTFTVLWRQYSLVFRNEYIHFLYKHTKASKR